MPVLQPSAAVCTGQFSAFCAPAAIPGWWVAVLHSPQTLVRSKSCPAAPAARSRAAMPRAADHCGVASGAVPGFCALQGFCTLERLSLHAVRFCTSHPFKSTLESAFINAPLQKPFVQIPLGCGLPSASPLWILPCTGQGRAALTQRGLPCRQSCPGTSPATAARSTATGRRGRPTSRPGGRSTRRP